MWPYRSHNALMEAGFKSRGLVPCPLCRRDVAIYQIPGTMPVFLDPENFLPHLDFQHDHGLPLEYVDQKSAAGDRI